MANRIAGITIDIGGNTTKLQSALKDVNKALKETQSDLRDVNKLLKLDPKNTELLRQKQDLLSKAIDETKKKLEMEKQALEQMKNSDATGRTKEQQERLTREIIETEKNLEKLETEYKSFGKTGVSAANQAADKMKELGSNMKAVGDKMVSVGKDLTTKVTAPIVAVGAASMAAWSEVDDALDTVTIKTGASGKALDDMQQRVKNLATTIPVSFGDAAVAIGEVNTRFSITGQQLEDVSAEFLKFAKINQVDVNSSIDSVQKAMDAFGLSANDAGAFLDTLNKVGQETGVDVGKLTDVLVSNATALRGMGMNAADAMHLLGDLEKTGIDTSVVMTGFAKVQKEAMESGTSMQKAFRSALSSSEKAIDTFGAKAGPKLYQAFKDGTLSVDMFTGGVYDLNDALGNLDETYDAVQDPTDKFGIAMNELKIVGHDLGEVMQKELAPIIEEVVDVLKDFKAWFDSLDEETKQSIVRIGAIVAALGPVVVVLGSVISAIGTIISSIGGVVHAGAGLVGMFGSTSVAAGGATAALGGTTTAASGLGAAVSGLALPFAAAAAGVASAALMISAYWDDLRRDLPQTFNIISDLMRAQINQTVSYVKLFATQGKIAFTQFSEDMKSKISEGVEKARTGISTGLGAAQTYINTFGNSARNTMQMTWSNITSRISGAMTSIRTGISSGFASAQSAATSAMNSLKSSVSGIWSSIQSNTSTVVGSIKNNTTELWNTLQSNISSAMSTAKNNVSTAWTSIRNATSDARTAVRSALSEMTNKMQDFGGSVWTNLKNNVSSAWSGITSTINTALTNIKNAIANTTLKFGSVTIPTFSWSGSNNSEKGTTANIKVGTKTVNYASAMTSGAILDRPTIFGALDGNLLRAGEAGKEVVIGANSLSSMIRQSATNTALNATVANILGLLVEYLPETANQSIVLDSGKLVGALTPALNRQFGMMVKG